MTWLIACAAQVSLIARNRAFSASLPPPGVSGASLASNVFFALLSVSLANAEATLGAPPECATPSRSTQSRHAVLTALDAVDKGLDFADALHVARSARAATFATFDQRLVNRAKRLALTPPVELLG